MKKILYLFIAMMVYSCSEGEEPCKPTPTLTTNEAKDINDTSATLIGEVIAPTCDKTVTSQGFVYSETTLPKITDNVVEVSGVDISKQISDLKQNKTYYYRTFFTNPIGTFYGNEVTFTTQVGSAILNATSISNITAISATASSSVIGAGEGQITKRGVCWSTNQNPTTADSKTEDGTGIGQFSSELTNLTVNTTYFVRTYTINEAGTTYGNEVSFKTRDGVILLTTKQISNITINSAVSGGNITDDGGAPVTIRGVCWSINTNPTILDNKTEDGSGIGEFTSELKNLSSGLTYYFRSYSTNNIGTVYGNEFSYEFGTYSAGNVFCEIGPTKIIPVVNPNTGRIWMDRNLGASQVASNSSDSNSYGDLYNWGRVSDGHQCRSAEFRRMTPSSTDEPGHAIFITGAGLDWRDPRNLDLWQGLNGINNPCPSGYRLPTVAEFNTETLSWSSKDAEGAYNSNLKLPLAGSRWLQVNCCNSSNNGIIHQTGSQGLYFTSTIKGFYNPNLIVVNLVINSNNLNRISFNEGRLNSGGSVRCIKD